MEYNTVYNESLIRNDTDMLDNYGKTLEELNEEEAKQYIGGIVFVTVLMVTGTIGNIHVLLVYAFRMKPSNHRVFILCLAFLDLITCVIGMPFIIVDLRNPLTFTQIPACKLLRFVNYFICTSSALVLLVISIDRYKKICAPLGHQISQKVARILCLVVLGVALILSWPAPVLYGYSTVELDGTNITGVRCYTEDGFKNTKYMAYFNAVLILVVFGVLGVLTVLYSLIARAIVRQNKFKSRTQNVKIGSASLQTVKDTTETKSSGVENERTMEIRCEEKGNKKSVIETVMISSGPSSSSDGSSMSTRGDHGRTTEKKLLPKKTAKFDRVKRTTLMLFLITLVFFLSYVPHLVLKIITFANKGFVGNMTFTGRVFYNTFLWCFFINNMANGIIYGFCDQRFRMEVKQAYKRCASCFRQ